MDAEAEPPKPVWTWCFWIALAVVLIVFVVPVESHTEGGVTFNYTLWDKITERGPSSGEIHLSH